MKIQYLRSICLIILVLFSKESTFADKNCSKEKLHDFRSKNFNKEMTDKNFELAAKNLDNFLENNDCWGSLIENLRDYEEGDIPSEVIKDAEEYLWAKSDLALANLKADNPGKCLEIIEIELNQYFFNPLKIIASGKLDKAFATNLSLCEKRRNELFPEINTTPCPIKNFPNKASIPSGESQTMSALKIEAIRNKIKAPELSGFNCFAVIDLISYKGLLDGFCDDTKSCQESEDKNDAEEVVVSKIFGVQEGEPAKLTFIDYPAEENWCGNPKISLHKDIRAGLSAPPNIMHIKSDLSPCVLGTGRAKIDSYFAVKDQKLIPIDESNPGYH